MSESTPLLARLTEPPNATSPPPESPVPAETVSEELARFALVMPAEPERFALVKPETVSAPLETDNPDPVRSEKTSLLTARVPETVADPSKLALSFSVISAPRESRRRGVVPVVVMPPFRITSVAVEAPRPVIDDKVSASVPVMVTVPPE